MDWHVMVANFVNGLADHSPEKDTKICRHQMYETDYGRVFAKVDHNIGIFENEKCLQKNEKQTCYFAYH
ncbi:hypothetical protein BpHYR1_018967 [Brachionus plicatilis]|uniref:Uncharacterized protein n=1 Tax=Brachionus plicatilis TaxID=10195 RepID=A0A3M7QMN0_BRAPC|nr:hypothetical protein BpHYR1_018967 [Brachionus plicatilis]